VDFLKSTFRIEFTEAIRPWLDLRGIFRAFSGNPSLEIQGQPITVDRAEKHHRLILEVRGVTLHQEGRRSLRDSADEAVRTITAIDEVLPLPIISSVRFDALFIEGYPLPFHDLVARFKGTFIQPSPIGDPAVDIGLSLDYQDGDVVRHIQLGPMEPLQLKSTFLIWPSERLPDQFLFISLGYEHKREMRFDRQEVTDVLAVASQWQETQGDQLRRDLVRPGGG
jgi:hypothetical protein